MSDQEKSKFGDPTYRYDDMKAKEFELAIGDPDTIDAVSNHIQKHIGPIASVFHEVISNQVHIDVHWVKPSERFNFHTLVTSGMSVHPMNTAPGEVEDKYAELCILLPPEWPITQSPTHSMKDSFPTEDSYWPYFWLNYIARMPHLYNTSVGFGHTVATGAEYESYAPNTKLCCVLLLPSLTLGNDFFTLNMSKEKTIKFYCLYPLYKEELDLKLEEGSSAILSKFDEFGISDVVDIDRVNTCKEQY